MRAKDLAEILLQYPHFDVHFGLIDTDDSPYGIYLRTFEVQVDDIGYSSEVIILGPSAEL